AWAREALHVARAMKEKEWEGLAFHHMGLTQARLGREAEGLASFQRALAIWETIGDLKSMGYAYRFIAHAFHEAKGRLDEALVAYSRALEIFQRIRASEHIAAIQLSQGTIYERKGDLTRARRAYLASIETLEAMRRKLTSEEHKLVFFERRLDPYEALISLLLKLYRQESRLEDGALALQLSERARARTALDLLQEVSGKIRAGVDETTLERERDLRAQYYAVARELLGQRSPESINLLRGRLEILELKYSDFLRELESRYPAYARLKNPQPLTLAEIQKQVLREGEVLLEYFVGEQETYLFIAGKERLETILTLPVGKRELAEKVEALRRPFERVKLTQRLGTLRAFDLRLAHELYGILLKPAEPYIPTTASAILLVPHGPLFYLPFELLVMELDFRPEPAGVILGQFETARYVLEVYPPISYAPSASVLDPRLRRERGDLPPKDILLAFGNPTAVEPAEVKDADADGDSQPGRGDPGAAQPLQVKGSVRMRGGESIELPPLPYSEQEVKEVAKLYGERAKVYLRGDATKDRFLSEGPGYPLVLLSTHGIFDERHPMYSALVFAPKTKGGDFELLETHEIFNMRLNAELVTLSACELGLGRIREGEGLVGMSRAFLYAGASSLVVSLWSVYDRSTAQLITGLYRRMQQAPGARARALRESKLKVLRTRQRLKSGRKEFSYAHPFFWAAFILMRGP
ncbi:MAG: CHAT domain-containing protein, partial [Nitrospinota bacterium]